MICKGASLFNLEILGVFVNTVTADDKYPVRDYENLQFSIQMQSSYKQKFLSEFFKPFMKCPSNLKDFRKKMIVISNVFPKLQTVKELFKPLFQNFLPQSVC